MTFIWKFLLKSFELQMSRRSVINIEPPLPVRLTHLIMDLWTKKKKFRTSHTNEQGWFSPVQTSASFSYLIHSIVRQAKVGMLTVRQEALKSLINREASRDIKTKQKR